MNDDDRSAMSRGERVMRWLMGHAAQRAIDLGWDLPDFCDLAAKEYVRHMTPPEESA